MVEIFVPDARRGDEAIRSSFGEAHKQAGAHEPRHPGGKRGADAVGEKGGNQTVGGVPLGRHGPPLRIGDSAGDLFQLLHFLIREAASAQVKGADQGAMHDEIGVAANGRGEMGVAPQVETEMPEILRAVFGLGLAAQDHFADELRGGRGPGLRENAIELSRLERAGLGQVHADGRKELAQRHELLLRGCVMHAIDQRRALGFERLGRGYVRLDHELFDEAMGVEPGRGRDGADLSLVVEQDLTLRQIEVERSPFGARQDEAGIGAPQRAQHRVEQRPRGLVGPAVDGGLGLLVAQACRRAHQRAEEAMTELSPASVENHAYGEAGAGDVFLQRAQIVRDALRQHRHHAIGEVDRVAALAGFLVEALPGVT
ncbi:hypothetical protein AUC71_09280 [Methyloceanibacter marginalis]|uniref:Uncharacterized protein n=1 Tax=Methyloceanibacter marginalis TaxID=1774971 RepID=A0A1E3WD98_9HYPH|nr:hypothetical protein AUC71_09280 [Methyloceanibacter marginalis]